MPEELEATVDAAPATSETTVAPGNCVGELVELPDVAGTTYHSYECQVCHQVLHVGLEDLEANGLPREHSPVLV